MEAEAESNEWECGYEDPRNETRCRLDLPLVAICSLHIFPLHMYALVALETWAREKANRRQAVDGVGTGGNFAISSICQSSER